MVFHDCRFALLQLQLYRGAGKSLAPPGRKQATATEDFDVRIYSIYTIIIIRGILVLFIYITRLASKEIFSPSNKIHREVGRAKDLSAPLYITARNFKSLDHKLCCSTYCLFCIVLCIVFV